MAEPKYVVGFLFNKTLTEVVLIHKTKPAWQNGFLNGVGGKVEPGEFAYDAMAREFVEETGYEAKIDWKMFATFHLGVADPEPSAHNKLLCVFTACADVDSLEGLVTTTTEEVVTILNPWEVEFYQTVPNLKWLVPMARDYFREHGGIKFAEIIF